MTDRIMAKPDLTYGPAGMFVAFYPETAAGEAAWAELAAHSLGTAKFLPTQLDAIVAQLRAAGYRVAKAKPVKLGDLDAALGDLDAMLAKAAEPETQS